jgi:hypothetical protein
VLCVRCNNAIGLFQESRDLFQVAADDLSCRDDGLTEFARERARALTLSY